MFFTPFLHLFVIKSTADLGLAPGAAVLRSVLEEDRARDTRLEGGRDSVLALAVDRSVCDTAREAEDSGREWREDRCEPVTEEVEAVAEEPPLYHPFTLRTLRHESGRCSAARLVWVGLNTSRMSNFKSSLCINKELAKMVFYQNIFKLNPKGMAEREE